MNDDVHAELIEKLAKQNFSGITPDLRAELCNTIPIPTRQTPPSANQKTGQDP
jgi:hypothetical protein